MRLIATAVGILTFFLQIQPLPPPYPRDGTTKLFENERVIVWDVTWLQQAYPVHRHIYDYSGVYYTNGDRFIISESGARSRTSSVAWDTFFYRRGVTHSEEGASSDPLRGVFVEFKEPAPLGVVATNASSPTFPGAPGRKLRESERVVIWEFVPGPGPSAHHHARDAVVVGFTNLKPRVTFVSRGTVHTDEQIAGADRAYVFELQ